MGEECGDVRLNYVLFDDSEKGRKLNQLMNQAIPKDVLALKNKPQSLQSFLKEHFQDSDFTYDYMERVAFLDDHVLSLEYVTYIYSGGAHGNSGHEFVTFDLNRNKALALEDILKEDKITELMQVAQKSFKQDLHLDQNKPLADQGFWFSKEDGEKIQSKWIAQDGFYLPHNFNVNQEGIIFVYQPYEVTNYAMGAPTFLMKWQDLAPFLKPDGIGQYYSTK
jgi:hypothetical protein